MLSPTGRRARPKPTKDPVRVAVGERCAASENHISKSGAVRSVRFGYDCYLTGSINSAGKVRCVLRPGRLPAHIASDIKLILPLELWWPERDHRAAHAMVDAVLSFELSALASWKSQWPGHEFGFEEFMRHAERLKLAAQGNAAAERPKVPQRISSPTGQAAVGGGSPMPRQLRLFPGKEVSAESHGGYDTDTYAVRLKLVRFDDETSALRVDVGGTLAGGEKLLCSRAYVDLVDGKFELVENYPGRLQALGLPKTLIYTVLGLRSPRDAPQRVLRGPAEGDRERQVDKTLREARKVHAVLHEGDPLAEAPTAKREEPEPVPIAGNKRYEAKLAAERDEPQETDSFPEAPGRWP